MHAHHTQTSACNELVQNLRAKGGDPRYICVGRGEVGDFCVKLLCAKFVNEIDVFFFLGNFNTFSLSVFLCASPDAVICFSTAFCD